MKEQIFGATNQCCIMTYVFCNSKYGETEAGGSPANSRLKMSKVHESKNQRRGGSKTGKHVQSEPEEQLREQPSQRAAGLNTKRLRQVVWAGSAPEYHSLLFKQRFLNRKTRRQFSLLSSSGPAVVLTKQYFKQGAVNRGLNIFYWVKTRKNFV